MEPAGDLVLAKRPTVRAQADLVTRTRAEKAIGAVVSEVVPRYGEVTGPRRR